MLNKVTSVPFFESLVWFDVGLNPGLLDHWQTLLIRPMAWLILVLTVLILVKHYFNSNWIKNSFLMIKIFFLLLFHHFFQFDFEDCMPLIMNMGGTKKKQGMHLNFLFFFGWVKGWSLFCFMTMLSDMLSRWHCRHLLTWDMRLCHNHQFLLIFFTHQLPFIQASGCLFSPPLITPKNIVPKEK